MSAQQLNYLPLIERLLDDKPELAYEKRTKTEMSLEELHDDIRNNLEHLLNTRSRLLMSDFAQDEVVNSVLNYGVIDFSHTYFGNRKAQDSLCAIIKKTLAHFEPRLERIVVTALDEEETQRVLHLRIEAYIALKPEPKPAIFESSLDLSRQRFMFDSH